MASDSAEFPKVIGRAPPRVIGRAPPRVFGRASSRVGEVRGGYNIGTPVIKRFPGIPYNDNIVSDNRWCYKVKYEDNNEEELTHCDITKCVQQENKIALKNSWNNAYLG